MINVVITGLYNRGQQDEYIELEAAGRCSLDGLMVLRYLNNPEGFPIHAQTRVFDFPETNVRKGNRIRLYTAYSPVKKMNTPEGITYNFSWNLDAPIWDGANVSAEVMQCNERLAFMPTEPITDLPSPEERGTFIPLSGENVLQSLFQAAVEGRFNVIGEKGDALPVRITGAPAEAQEFIDKGDFAGLTRYVQEMKKREMAAMKAEKRKK